MKSEELGKIGITGGTPSESKKSECKNIGQKQTWSRNCHRCNRTMIYTNELSFRQISKRNSVCRVCCQIGNGHPHTEAHKKYMSKLLTGRQITWKDKIKENHWSKDPVKRKKISEAQSRLICDLIRSGKLNGKNKSFRHGYWSNSTTGKMEFYRSSDERNKMESLNNDASVETWTTKHNIRIPYNINGIVHYYLPDFLIILKSGDTIIEEVKGYVENKDLLRRKIKAAKSYCKHRNIQYKISYDNHSKNSN